MITTYLFLQGALLLLAVGGFFQVQHFLRNNPSISTARDLDNFKRLARVNMYVALVYIVLSIPVVLISMYLGFSAGLTGVAIVLVASAPHFALGQYMKKLEEKSRTLECASQYAEEHRRIGQVWQKKALPDF
jgi:hypothetical protein